MAACKLMSFNIRNGEANDGEHAWPFRREFVADLLREQRPEVIGLQEALWPQLEFLAEQLTDYDWVAVAREDGRQEGETCAILFRRDRFRLRRSETFWLSETPQVPGSRSWDSACTRICTVAELLSDEGPLHVLNCHLDHVSAQARYAGMRLVLDRMPQARAVLMGDLNEGENGAAVQAARDAGLVDTFRAVHPAAIRAATFMAFDPTLEDGEKIDYLFATPDLEIVDAEIVRTLRHGRPPSDHFPITATVML